MKVCGFILAAGLGTRLRPLFPDIPKPLVPLAGRPAIARAIDFLESAGVTRIIVNAHYQRDRIKAELPPLFPPGVELTVSEEETLLGTGGGILKAREYFSSFDWLVVTNADILTDFRPSRTLEKVEKEGADVCLVLSSSGPRSEWGKVGLLPSGKLWFPGQEEERVKIRPGIFIGVHFVRPSVLQSFELKGPVSIVDLYRQLIREGKNLRGTFTKKFWVDLGTEDGYRRGLRHLSEGSKG